MFNFLEQEKPEMICDYCHGKHIVVVRGKLQPCEECGGMGEIHCCEGLMAQPEPVSINAVPPFRSALLAEHYSNRYSGRTATPLNHE